MKWGYVCVWCVLCWFAMSRNAWRFLFLSCIHAFCVYTSLYSHFVVIVACNAAVLRTYISDLMCVFDISWCPIRAFLCQRTPRGDANMWFWSYKVQFGKWNNLQRLVWSEGSFGDSCFFWSEPKEETLIYDIHVVKYIAMKLWRTHNIYWPSGFLSVRGPWEETLI